MFEGEIPGIILKWRNQDFAHNKDNRHKGYYLHSVSLIAIMVHSMLNQGKNKIQCHVKMLSHIQDILRCCPSCSYFLNLMFQYYTIH